MGVQLQCIFIVLRRSASVLTVGSRCVGPQVSATRHGSLSWCPRCCHYLRLLLLNSCRRQQQTAATTTMAPTARASWHLTARPPALSVGRLILMRRHVVATRLVGRLIGAVVHRHRPTDPRCACWRRLHRFRAATTSATRARRRKTAALVPFATACTATLIRCSAPSTRPRRSPKRVCSSFVAATRVLRTIAVVVLCQSLPSPPPQRPSPSSCVTIVVHRGLLVDSFAAPVCTHSLAVHHRDSKQKRTAALHACIL